MKWKQEQKMPKSDIIPCTKEEMDRLIDVAMNDDFFYMLFKVAKKTGRRIGEYYDIRVKDVDFEKKVMLTKVLKRRKRVIKEAVLDDELIYLIKAYIRKNGLKLDDYLFRKVGYRQIQNKVIYYSKIANIPHSVSFHNFRHYFVTQLTKAGWTYEKISKLTGHGSIRTLSGYDHSSAADVAEKAREDIKFL